jgi:hypothetical protein
MNRLDCIAEGQYPAEVWFLRCSPNLFLLAAHDWCRQHGGDPGTLIKVTIGAVEKMFIVRSVGSYGPHIEEMSVEEQWKWLDEYTKR